MDEKPKQSAPTLTRLAGDALVESIDGPIEIVKLVGKVMPVLTRFPDGRLGFRMMTQVREVEPEQDLLRLTNSEGQFVLVGGEHVFLAADGKEVRARDLREGHELGSGWSYPPGYVLPDAEEYAVDVRGQGWRQPVLIKAVELAGRGPLFGASVKETKSYFLTFGAHCRAQK